jgi:hypothetical protein
MRLFLFALILSLSKDKGRARNEFRSSVPDGTDLIPNVLSARTPLCRAAPRPQS